MTAPTARDRATNDARRAWMTAGVLLIVSSVLALAVPSAGLALPGGDLVRSVCFSAALLIFAFGFRGSVSVTGRRPLGTTALVVLAAWSLLFPYLERALIDPATIVDATWFTLSLGYIETLVTFAATLVAAVQIGRAGVVRPPWNWAPAWAVAAVAVPWVADQLLLTAALQGGALDFAIALSYATGLIYFGAVVFLGVLAIVLANAADSTRTVPIFSSRD